MSMLVNERELLKSFNKNDDKEVFSQLFNLYFEKLARYVFSLSGDYFQSEEIAQETLVSIWEKRGRLKMKTSLNAYLYRTAYNNYLNSYAKNKRRLKILEDLRLETILELEHSESEQIDKKLVFLRQGINDMPPVRKEIFTLNKLQNYTYKEIAQMRNISERTVESHIRKALIGIRAQAEKLQLPVIIVGSLFLEFFF